MDAIVSQLTANVEPNEILDEIAAQQILKEMDFAVPADYVEYMFLKNGGEGAIGEEGYIRLWMLQELMEANQDYAVQEFAPGLFLIGSDGGDAAYGLRKDDLAFIEVPFIGMSIHEVKVLGYDFAEFLQAIANRGL
ncbi:SMI1/KNR4 family protein [Chitinophaga sp.]|uniref:SMI1/KNR4 family protein n=1 Tax=Chitinophaga sp. TaxID=1869181 RepID=UPI002619CF52|nr:SMI1/KNR4 family protein [uncultured Chitinophaga sp.]